MKLPVTVVFPRVEMTVFLEKYGYVFHGLELALLSISDFCGVVECLLENDHHPTDDYDFEETLDEKGIRLVMKLTPVRNHPILHRPSSP